MARPPKFAPERRNTGVGVVHLPAKGYSGKVPPWPLPLHLDLDFATREEAVWAHLWRTPQAAAWIRLGWTRAVARYCRMVVASEMPSHLHCKECDAPGPPAKLDASLLAQVTAMEDRLGLTPKAMRLLLWIIDHDEVAEARTGRSAAAASGRYLQAVDPELLLASDESVP